MYRSKIASISGLFCLNECRSGFGLKCKCWVEFIIVLRWFEIFKLNMHKESKKPNLKVHFVRAHLMVKGCKYWGLSVYGRWGIFIVSTIPAFTPDFGLHRLVYRTSSISHHRSRSWCYRSWCVCKSLYHVTRPHDHYKFKFSLYISWFLQYIFKL